MLSQVSLSVVCNDRASYSGGWNFRQYFVWYIAHPLISTENFTEIVQGEPLQGSAGGAKHKRGSQI